MTVWSILHINSAWLATVFRRGRLVKSSDPNAFNTIDQIKAISKDHETAGLLHELSLMAICGRFPLAFRPYHDIYLQNKKFYLPQMAPCKKKRSHRSHLRYHTHSQHKAPGLLLLIKPFPSQFFSNLLRRSLLLLLDQIVTVLDVASP